MRTLKRLTKNVALSFNTKIGLSTFLLLISLSCREKTAERPAPTYEFASLVFNCTNQDQKQSVLIVDVLTEKIGEEKTDVAVLGRLLMFDTKNISTISTEINATFLDLERNESNGIRSKLPSVTFINRLKKIATFKEIRTINELKLRELLSGKETSISNILPKRDYLNGFFSLFSTQAIAQQNQVEKIVLKLMAGLALLPSCSLRLPTNNIELIKFLTDVADIENIPDPCGTAMDLIRDSAKELWNDIIAKSILDALDPNSKSDINNFAKNQPSSSGNGNSGDGGGGVGGGGWGDPHLNTFDGSYYDFQAVGEFIACKATSDALTLQVRQEEYKLISRKMASVTTALAFNNGADIVFIQENPFKLYINKNEMSTSFTEYGLKNSGKVTKSGNELVVTNNTGDNLKIRLRGQYLDYVLTLNKNRRGKVGGLLGNFDENRTNDLATSGGIPVKSDNFKEFYSTFSDSWRITQAQSLFEYESGKNTSSYTDKNFPSQEFQITKQQYDLAYKTCTEAGIIKEPALSSCIYDVALTGKTEWAKNYLNVQSEFSNKGLVAYYPFNGSANDESGNNNNGEVFGATLTNDRNGKPSSAYSFNGRQQFIRVPNSLMFHNMGQEISISAWVLVKEWQGGAWGCVACKATSAKPHFQFQLYYNSKNATFATDGRLNDKSNYQMDLNKWYHLVLVIDGQTRRYFVNGELIGIEVNQKLIQPDYSPLEFGRDFYAATEYHIGSLDDIRIYNRVLSLGEIKGLFVSEN